MGEWWSGFMVDEGRYLGNFARASLEQGRLDSIGIRGGFVCGASSKKMESPEKMELRQLLELEKKGNMGFIWVDRDMCLSISSKVYTLQKLDGRGIKVLKV
ncbi:hypothetical protein H5410_012490 [Solanum commersonii]|uniref:Uncharacterized protein n=1 Tax=Solanum commersonii TaxID=4109 RepID=A0A9J6ARP0_SOLCO|nr:hypothetical protein H5410_012490 [Solanum commersonii]